ncbi:MAG: DUF4401 domain-containing protein [Zoogloeaceae bacterium]|jgi:hypothetical protein|nr:DUF4401 domain-containing protein [Zoogloeaceae bacterium]
MKPQELWNTLHAAGFTRQEEMPAVAPPAPWYLETIRFLALWTGAALIVCAIVFAIVVFVGDVAVVAGLFLFFGLLLVVLACWLFRTHPGHFFLGQLAHAASLCWVGLLVIALAVFPGEKILLSILLALALLVFCTMNNFVQRLVAACAALFVLVALGTGMLWLDCLGIAHMSSYCPGYMRPGMLWLECLGVACSVAFVLVWQMEMKTLHYSRNQIWRSMGYALALFLLVAMNVSFAFWMWMDPIDSIDSSGLPPDPPRILRTLRVLSGLPLFWFAAWFLKKEGVSFSSRPVRILLGATLYIALAGMEMPFVAVALLILVTGFAANAPVLLGIGAVMLLNVCGQYYYWLEVSLLRKSLYLLLTGGVLLACRLALRKGLREDEHA